MRYLAVFLFSLVQLSALGQLQSYSLDVFANQGSQRVNPVLFAQIGPSVFFTAVAYDNIHSPNRFQLSLIDSCGNASASSTIAIERLSGVYEYDYQVIKQGNKYILLARIDHRVQLFFLGKDLKPIASMAFVDYGQLKVFPFGEDKVVVQNFGKDNRAGFWVVDPEKEDVQFYSMTMGNGQGSVFARAMASTENGELYLVGEVGLVKGAVTNFHFLTAYDENLDRLYTQGYKTRNGLPMSFDDGAILFVDQENESLALLSGDSDQEEQYHLLKFTTSGMPLSFNTYTITQATTVLGNGLGRMTLAGNGFACSTPTALLDDSHRKGLVCLYDYNKGLEFYKSPYILNPYYSADGLESINGFSHERGIVIQGVRWGEKRNACTHLEALEDVKTTSHIVLLPETFPIPKLEKRLDKNEFLSVSLLLPEVDIDWEIGKACPELTLKSFDKKDTTVCVGTAAQLVARSSGNNVIWNTGATTSSILSDTSGLFYNRSTSGFCVVVDSQQLTVADSIGIDLPDSSEKCPDESFDFGLEKKSYNYEWLFPNGSKQLGLTLDTEEKGLYRLRVYGGGCKVLDSVKVSFFEIPNASAGPDGKICKGDTLTLLGDGGETYLWTPADFLNDDRLKNPKAFPPNTQLYRVVVTSKEGCHDTDFVNLLVNPKPVAGFLPMPANASIADKGVLFSNLGNNSSGYRWFVNQAEQTREANFNFLFPDTGNFQIVLLATSPEGCSDSALLQLRVDPAPLMFIPNAFTPNGDGLNDEFAPSSFYYEQYEMTIFSKTGQRIWKSSDTNAFPVWDARLDKSLETVPVGTYLYIIKGKSQDGDEYEFSGKVHVVR